MHDFIPTPDASRLRVMLAENNTTELARQVEALLTVFDVHVTCVSSLEDALTMSASTQHDLLICNAELAGDAVRGWMQRLRDNGVRDVVLTATDPTAQWVVQALRCGIADVLIQPFDNKAFQACLLDQTTKITQRQRLIRRRSRIRHLVRRVLRERREIQERMEFLCREVVSAHRQLVHKVLSRDAS